MKPGPKPKGKVKIKWSPEFAYAAGLLVADGCLSKSGRHIILTSKDKQQLRNFKKCLGLNTKIKLKFSGHGNRSYYVQFGDVMFYKFLVGIGLTPAKSKTLGKLLIDTTCFPDFLRGYFDGDGCSFSYYDPVWKNNFRFYISFASGSLKYVEWLRSKLSGYLGIKGHLSYSTRASNIQLRYSKYEAVKIAKMMYHKPDLVCLRRKHKKISKSLSIISRSGGIGRHAAFRALWA